MIKENIVPKKMRMRERKEKKGGRERERHVVFRRIFIVVLHFNLAKKKKEKKCLFEMNVKKNWQRQVLEKPMGK